MNFTYKPGTPVVFQVKNDENFNNVYARVLTIYKNDKTYITCITPHGSIFRVKTDNLYFIDDESTLEKLKNIETDAISLNYHIFK